MLQASGRQLNGSSFESTWARPPEADIHSRPSFPRNAVAKSIEGTSARCMHMPSSWQLGAAAQEKQNHSMQAARRGDDTSRLPAVHLPSHCLPGGASASRACHEMSVTCL